MRPLRAAVVASLLVLAGCSAVVDGPPGATDGPVDRWTGDADNPYEEAELTVAVDGSANASRDWRPLVRRALDYWEANDERYAGYPVEYRLVDDADGADVVVTFVDAIDDCGIEDHAAGCAPHVTDGPVERPVDVRVLTGFSDASTVQVLKHELGHTLGLGHGDDPHEVMRAKSDLTTLPRPDATERALPWNHSTLSVYVDDGAVPEDEREATRRQVDAALDYYARGADGTVPANVSFVRTDDRAAADVVITFGDDPCGADRGSCGSVEGIDPDGDGALERYTRLRIALVGLDTDAVAWHVGRWLGTGFGFDEEADYPDPLDQDASYQERRSEWWQRSVDG